MSPITWTVVLLAGLTCVCGLGVQTDISSYRSLVQVEDRVGVVWLQQCLGSVLTSYHVLTTAGCVKYITTFSTRNRRVRAGTSYRGVEGTVLEVTTAYSHPSYGTLGKDGDIAVVRLESALPLGSNIAQASILGQGITLPTNLPVNLATWGTTTEGSVIGNDNLYNLTLYVVNINRCVNKYYGTEDVTENMFCFGRTYTSGRDLDSRDYGAPIFYDGVVVGVISFGVSNGDDEYPIVSTAVSSYTQWISDTAVYY